MRAGKYFGWFIGAIREMKFESWQIFWLEYSSPIKEVIGAKAIGVTFYPQFDRIEPDLKRRYKGCKANCEQNIPLAYLQVFLKGLKLTSRINI